MNNSTYSVSFNLSQLDSCDKKQIITLNFPDNLEIHPIISINPCTSISIDKLNDLINIFRNGLLSINENLIEYNKKNTPNEEKSEMINKFLNLFRWCEEGEQERIGGLVEGIDYDYDSYSFFTICLETGRGTAWNGNECEFHWNSPLEKSNIKKSTRAIYEFLSEIKKRDAYIEINLKEKIYKVLMQFATLNEINTKLLEYSKEVVDDTRPITTFEELSQHHINNRKLQISVETLKRFKNTIP